jgi:hypothetical protein
VTQSYAISCLGAARHIANRMKEATKVCGGKYQILGRDRNVVGGAAVATGNGAVWAGVPWDTHGQLPCGLEGEPCVAVAQESPHS